MRKILGFGVLLGLLIALSSCGSLTGGRTVVSVEIELPAEVAEHQLVGVTVTAVGSEGSRPFRGFGGTVDLSASAGSLTVDGLDLANGRGTAEVRLSGAEGLLSIRATAGGINGLDRHGCRAFDGPPGRRRGPCDRGDSRHLVEPSHTRAGAEGDLRVRAELDGVSHVLLDWEGLQGQEGSLTLVTRTADISAFAGETVTIYFEHRDPTGEWGFRTQRYLDNISIR